MEQGLINKELKRFCMEGGTDLGKVQQYLLLKYNIEVERSVLEKRLEKLSPPQKAVA
jgi:hypothetical protein